MSTRTVLDKGERILHLRPEIVHTLLNGVKVSPLAAAAWITALSTLAVPPADSTLTLGQMSEDCERHGHLFRVYRVLGNDIWLDHDDRVEIATLQVQLGTPDFLAGIDSWRVGLHEYKE